MDLEERWELRREGRSERCEGLSLRMRRRSSSPMSLPSMRQGMERLIHWIAREIRGELVRQRMAEVGEREERVGRKES